MEVFRILGLGLYFSGGLYLMYLKMSGAGYRLRERGPNEKIEPDPTPDDVLDLAIDLNLKTIPGSLFEHEVEAHRRLRESSK